MLRAAIRNSWLAPTLFAAAVCFSHIHQGTIAVDAIRYSAIASNILESGDWIHLYDRFTESAYANKPPLLFWSLAGIFHTVGFSTFAAKFPAVLFTFLSMLLVWRIWSKLGGEAAGLWAILLRIFFAAMIEPVVVAPAAIIAVPGQMARGQRQISPRTVSSSIRRPFFNLC